MTEPILYHQPRGIAPKWLKPITRKRLRPIQAVSKREKLDMLSWNRRLAKAGNSARVGADERKRYNRFNHCTYGLPIVQERPESKHLQSYRIRKDRSNGYRTDHKYYDAQLSDKKLPETVFWVEDIRTHERVTDAAILRAIVELVNDNSKWPYKLDQPTILDQDELLLNTASALKTYQGRYEIGKPSRRSEKVQIVFDKPGPTPLTLHQLGLVGECNCERCKGE